MSLSFYEASVGAYEQVLGGVANVLDKGAAHSADSGPALPEMVAARVHDDMMPLHFQIVSVCHHSLGALEGMRTGEFAPPSFDLDKDYAGLQAMVADTQAQLGAMSPEDVNALADGKLVFKLGNREMPFTNRNFLTSFSLPNFYFHATTTYDILRMLGVPLGKMDFLGQVKFG